MDKRQQGIEMPIIGASSTGRELHSHKERRAKGGWELGGGNGATQSDTLPGCQSKGQSLQDTDASHALEGMWSSSGCVHLIDREEECTAGNVEEGGGGGGCMEKK